MQLAVLLKLLTPSISARKLVKNAHTGVGKTHIIRVLETYARLIHLVLRPILALTADQVPKFLEGSDRYGSTDAHNMDLIPNEIKNKIIAKARRMKGDTTSTTFLFVSPQFLASNKTFLVPTRAMMAACITI